MDIVLDALHTKQQRPLSDSQESLATPAEERERDEPDVAEIPRDESVEINEEKIESWPQPPTSLELQSTHVLEEQSKRFIRRSYIVNLFSPSLFSPSQVLPSLIPL